jgi:hypothetical protein
MLTFVGMCNPSGGSVYHCSRLFPHIGRVAQNDEPEMEGARTMKNDQLHIAIRWDVPLRMFKMLRDKITAFNEERERQAEARWING